MSAPSRPEDAVVAPGQSNNSTIIEDEPLVASTVTISASVPSTELRDATSSSPSTDAPPVETPPVETSPVETSPVDTPPAETLPVTTASVEAPDDVDARPIATPPVGVPEEFPVPPEDADTASTSSSLPSTTLQAPEPSTTTIFSSTSTTSLTTDSTLTSSTEQIPPRSDDDGQSGEDRETVVRSDPVPSPVIETPPPVVEASPTDQPQEEPTSAEEPTSTAAEPVGDESPQEQLPEETSALPVPETDSPTDRNDEARGGDRNRVGDVEIIEQPAPIVAGPDEQVGDNPSEDSDDIVEEDDGGLGSLPGPTNIVDDPTTTTLPDGNVPTIKPGGRIPGPESDVPPDVPSETGNADLVEGGGAAGPAVIAGGVIGGVLGLALIFGLLFWFLKRRSDRRHNYVIKTPVFPPPKTGSSEKTWEFDTGSLGPTTRSAKLAEVMSNCWHAFGKVFKPPTATSVRSGRARAGTSTSRRSSEFMEDTLPPPAHSRHNSVKLDSRHLDRPEGKGMFAGWWSQGKQAATLSGAGAGQAGVQRNVPKRRSSEVIVGYGARRPLDVRSSKASSEDFAGALGLMLNKVSADNVSDPFSDNNEVRRNSAGAARSSSANPFADTYVVGNQYPTPRDDPRLHRPRGSTTGSISTPPPPFARPWAPTLDTRSYVRSDQFDLEIDGHNASISLSNSAYEEMPRRPASVARPHGRESYSSRVVSAMSSDGGLDGWGEPGPDVGLGSSTSHAQQQDRHPDRLPHIGEAM